MHCYSADELNSVIQDHDLDETQSGECSVTGSRLRPTPSETAHRLLGIWGVSEPAALLASGAKELLVTRKKTTRATIAVARIPFDDTSRKHVVNRPHVKRFSRVERPVTDMSGKLTWWEDSST